MGREHHASRCQSFVPIYSGPGGNRKVKEWAALYQTQSKKIPGRTAYVVEGVQHPKDASKDGLIHWLDIVSWDPLSKLAR